MFLDSSATLAHSAHARAWLAHGTGKFYRCERLYSISLRQLPPRLVRVLLVSFLGPGSSIVAGQRCFFLKEPGIGELPFVYRAELSIRLLLQHYSIVCPEPRRATPCLVCRGHHASFGWVSMQITKRWDDCKLDNHHYHNHHYDNHH